MDGYNTMKEGGAMDDEILNTEELCLLLKISRTTAWQFRKKGMPCMGSGKLLRYKKADVIKWYENRNKGKK